jgi:hypothetical protein
MAAVRRLPALLLLVAALSACGGGSGSGSKPTTSSATTASSTPPSPTTARSTTVAGKTARFTLLIDAIVGGATVRSSETGTIAFVKRLAHFYKLVPGGGTAQELIVDGPFTYTNANVDAALRDPSVKPWTKLDTRRLSARDRRSYSDELAHVRALVYLPDGIARTRRGESITVANQRVTRFSGTVDPARVVARAPAAERGSLAVALRNDYPAKPFFASYWLDGIGRVRRVLVSYTTPGGTEITLDGRFSEFGTTIDTTLPPARSIQDITP